VKGEDGEESKKSFFAYTGLEILGDVPLCRRKSKHKHSPQGNELCGMGSGEPPNQQMRLEARSPG